ncbi:MAG: hypothetical protein LAT62_03135 [Natronospirillum sp.]|uniref:hypothetical protein n=1 Tax=Natronospirillum sp. TaxID=2812955 RepID=UPI0025E30F8B|nr:hypothetical protein [Natronospirillum sp.]MCH8550903.1 hypothetical protein [Natronospirillum sp.]
MNMKQGLPIGLLGAALCLLTACDDSSNGNSSGGGGGGGVSGGATINVSGNITSLSDIVGVYEDFYDEGGGIIDEIYIEIAADGTVWEHDYQGDSYHQGPNCYDIWEWDEIEHRGGNTFYSDMSFAEFEARFENNRLIMDYGNGWEEEYGPKVNIDPANFRAAECTD